MKNRGFTLIELLAVITILGILAAFSTIAVNNIRKDQQKKNQKNVIVGILTGAKEYYADNRTYPSDGIKVEELLEGNYVSLDESKYKELLSAYVKKESCNNSIKTRYYLDKEFYEDNRTFKYEDCGCEEQPDNTNTKSETLCEKTN